MINLSKNDNNLLNINQTKSPMDNSWKKQKILFISKYHYRKMSRMYIEKIKKPPVLKCFMKRSHKSQ